MQLKESLDLSKPLPLIEVEEWIHRHTIEGVFSSAATIRIAKTTGQKPCLIISEER